MCFLLRVTQKGFAPVILTETTCIIMFARSGPKQFCIFSLHITAHMFNQPILLLNYSVKHSDITGTEVQRFNDQEIYPVPFLFLLRYLLTLIIPCPGRSMYLLPISIADNDFHLYCIFLYYLLPFFFLVIMSCTETNNLRSKVNIFVPIHLLVLLLDGWEI